MVISASPAAAAVAGVRDAAVECGTVEGHAQCGQDAVLAVVDVEPRSVGLGEAQPVADTPDR